MRARCDSIHLQRFQPLVPSLVPSCADDRSGRCLLARKFERIPRAPLWLLPAGADTPPVREDQRGARFARRGACRVSASLGGPAHPRAPAQRHCRVYSIETLGVR